MLDLKLRAMLDQMAAAGAPDLGDLPPDVGRQVYRQILTAGDLPPALVLVGSYDALRDDGVTYANRLIEAGVPATLEEYAGLSHGFINMAASLPGGRLALDQVGAALRIAIG